MNILKSSLEFVINKCNLEIIDDSTISFYSNYQLIKLKLIDNTFELNDNTYYENHFIRLFKINNFIMLTEYNIFDFFEFINENSNYLLNCTICGDNIINTSNKIRSCNKCWNKFVKIVSDNDIIDEYNNDKFAFSFILLTSYSCLQNPHRNELFKPLPLKTD